MKHGKMKQQYSIGELAKHVSVNIQTLRFYEKKQLLQPAYRRESGYRVYNESSLNQLQFILQAKELGFSLKEIKDLLELRTDLVPNCERVRKNIYKKLDEVRNKMRQLKELEKTLNTLAEECEKRSIPEKCPIMETLGN